MIKKLKLKKQAKNKKNEDKKMKIKNELNKSIHFLLHQY